MSHFKKNSKIGTSWYKASFSFLLQEIKEFPAKLTGFDWVIIAALMTKSRSNLCQVGDLTQKKK
ncbi:hypothetical protein BpHYR1_022025 [Brachionus plicatilis]|uniref:Uncharacterized protein n=1 Tax=Brachionus plicatilis TaxID=10195 RepID=A0A3M7PMC1_BRAPC|nr:hypothetical protein BpHYR1_022025 [Brachionus plicatilis]